MVEVRKTDVFTKWIDAILVMLSPLAKVFLSCGSITDLVIGYITQHGDLNRSVLWLKL